MPDRRATSAQDLLRRWDRFNADRGTTDSFCQEIAQYIAPWKSVITRTPFEGQTLTQFIFDGEAIWAATMLAATLAGSITSPSQEWFTLSLEPEELAEDKETQDWLGECAERMYAALGRSNFHAASLGLFGNLVHFGIGAMVEEEGPPLPTGEFGGLIFRVLPMGKFGISEDKEGQVDTLFHAFSLPARVAYEQWGDKAGEQVVRCATQQHYDQEKPFEFLQAIYPRFYRDRQRKTSVNMPWASYYVNIAEKVIIEESGFQEFPGMVPRWDLVPGQVYGFGPSHNALPDVKTCNAAKELILKSAPLKMMPPTIEKSDSVVGDIDLTPGGRNVSENGHEDLQFMDTRGDVRVDQIVLGDLHAAIDKYYFVEQLRLKESPAMTATEVLARREELERLLGPTAGRIESEYLNRLIVRTFAIMFRAKAFTQPPEAVTAWMRQRGGLAPNLNISYQGPLQRARRSLDVVAITATYQHILTAMQLDPTVVHVLKHRDIAREVAEIRGVDSKFVRDEKETLQLIAMINQAKQAEAQLQQVATMAEAAGKVAPLAQVLQRGQPPGQGGAYQPGQAA